jgi:hypothetical protein
MMPQHPHRKVEYHTSNRLTPQCLEDEEQQVNGYTIQFK